MLNVEYKPSSEYEDDIMRLLEVERRLTASEIADELDMHTAALNHYLHRLVAAGWIEQPRDRGTYAYVADPRRMSDGQIADTYREYARQVEGGEADRKVEKTK